MPALPVYRGTQSGMVRFFGDAPDLRVAWPVRSAKRKDVTGEMQGAVAVQACESRDGTVEHVHAEHLLLDV